VTGSPLKSLFHTHVEESQQDGGLFSQSTHRAIVQTLWTRPWFSDHAPHALVFKTRRWPFFIKIAYFHQISTEREYYMVSNIGVLQRFVSIVKKANT